MRKYLKALTRLLQILFYIFSGLSILAFIFYLFDAGVSFDTFSRVFLTTVFILILYFILYRIYKPLKK